jgi:alpha-L-fucosidase
MNNTTKRVFNDGRDWFFEKRFGLFVHWGLYAINGLHEQEQMRYCVPAEEYVKLIDKFNPVKFNPDRWLDLAQEAGMEYLVLTAKHHDGFCLWDTKLTDFNVMNSPYKRDIVAMLSEACHRRGINLEIYYSVVDWHHPAYPNIGRHHEIQTDQTNHNMDKYMDFLKGQIRELCSYYGTIHGIWWDMNVPEHKDPSVHEMIRKLQPSALINNRGFGDGDYSTPERDFDDEKLNGTQTYAKPTEACESIGAESWGYRDNEDYFSVGTLTRSFVKHFAKGANYLLNAGPRADGTFSEEAVRILRKIGQWRQQVKEAFEQVEPLPLNVDNGNILLGRKGNALYVYLLDAPRKSGITLKPLEIQPNKVTLLNNGLELKSKVEIMPSLHAEHKAYPHVWNIPVDELANEAVILKLEFEEEGLPQIWH